LIHQESTVIGIEGRAKFNDYVSKHNGDAKWFGGLTFWSPNINIFRDPRWGRGQETYGEDPFLSGTIGVQFIKGIQGEDPNYMLAMACAKHFAVHSGPEPDRHRFDAQPSERDLYEIYLPQFEMAVREGHVGGVMGAYNSVYGVPCCASSFLLADLLRKQLCGFGLRRDWRHFGPAAAPLRGHAGRGRRRRRQSRLQSLLWWRIQRFGAGGAKRTAHREGGGWCVVLHLVDPLPPRGV
jgi:hypothetical protein